MSTAVGTRWTRAGARVSYRGCGEKEAHSGQQGQEKGQERQEGQEGQEGQEVAGAESRRTAWAVEPSGLAAHASSGKAHRLWRGLIEMRRILRIMGVAALLVLPVFGVGCGANGKVKEEAETSQRRMPEADADEVGFFEAE